MDEKQKLMSDLDVAHNAVQHLNLEPSKGNLTNLLFVLQTLEKAYKFISEVPDAPDEKSDADA